MSRRSYRQHCALARTLDLVGDRWVLLLVRELLIGPRRYTELLEGLPAMGTNLLAARLKELEEAGLVERQPGRDARSHVYRLTPRGHALEPAVLELIRWGFPLLADTPDAFLDRSEWDVVALRAAFRPDAAAGVCASYQFRVDDTAFFARVKDGTVETGLGETAPADLSLRTDAGTWAAIGSGRLDLADAVKRGRVELKGRKTELKRLARLFAVG